MAENREFQLCDEKKLGSMDNQEGKTSSDETPFLEKNTIADDREEMESTTVSKSVGDEAPLLSKSEELPSPSGGKVESFTVDGSAKNSLKELEAKCAAYLRHDIYGTLGRGELCLKEKFFLFIAVITLLPLIRLVAGFVILVTYYAICKVFTLFKAPNREEENEQEDYAHLTGIRRSIIVASGRFLSRAMLFTLGFYWIKETYRTPDESPDEVQNNESDTEESLNRPGVIVSNHVSYLDILYHMSASFPSFVAKRSVARLPLVGLISKCLGCVFVQRESKSSDFKGVSGVVTERIQAAHHDKDAPMMMLFPGSMADICWKCII